MSALNDNNEVILTTFGLSQLTKNDQNFPTKSNVKNTKSTKYFILCIQWIQAHIYRNSCHLN